MLLRDGTLGAVEIRFMNTRTLIVAGALAGGLTLQAAEWRTWRGDTEGSGSAPDAETVSKFSDEDNLIWKVTLPGPGNSTPIITQDRILVTCGIDGNDAVVAYSMAGKELWRTSFGRERAGKGDNKQKGTGANSSIVTDGRGIFAYFKSGRVAALTMAGKKVWEINVQDRYGKDTLWWDEGTSPVIAGGLVVLAVMQTEGGSYMLGLEKNTGEVAWKVERNYDVGAESGDSYTTPLVMEVDGQETLVTWGADHLTGHDPKNGKLLWTCGGFNPNKTKFWRVISSPAATDGIVAVSYARGKTTGGVRVGGKGDITKEAWLWKRDGVGADAVSPIAHNGKFIVVNDSEKPRGLVSCLDAVTGKTIWEEQLPRAAQKFYSSPLLAGDKFYLARVDGVVYCGTVTEKGLSNLTENRLEDNIYASPIAVGERLFVRGRRNLYCLGDK